MILPEDYKPQTINDFIKAYKEGCTEIDENTRDNQNKRVLKFMMEHGSITQDDADGIKIRRLSARIFDLRNEGHQIVTDTVYGKNEYGPTRYARYRFEGGVLM